MNFFLPYRGCITACASLSISSMFPKDDFELCEETSICMLFELINALEVPPWVPSMVASMCSEPPVSETVPSSDCVKAPRKAPK